MARGRSGATVRSFPGNYSNYVKTRAVRELTQARQYEQDKAFLDKERAYITKHMAGQRTRQAQGRLKRLERRLEAGEFVLEKPGEQQAMKLSFGHAEPNSSAGTRSDKEVAHAELLSKAYDEKVLFRELDVSVWGSQRLGITGPNGTGKSTLLKILLGQLEPTKGKAWLSPLARVGYFAQEAVELHADRTVVDEILEVREDYLERDARNFAARFLFTDEDVFKKVGTLSGGEQSRVRFMKLMLTHPDMLILDEPTNHLDIASRENLEEALKDFPGTIITVSHDRYFLDRIAQKLLVMRSGESRYFNGNYTYYIEQVEQTKAATDTAKTGADRKPRRTGGKSQPSAKQPPKTRYQKMRLEDLETFIAGHEERIAELQERFGDMELYKDPDQLQALQAEFETLKTELTQAEEAWVEKAEA
jgi:ATP-binding cassette subfamily F protein 3